MSIVTLDLTLEKTTPVAPIILTFADFPAEWLGNTSVLTRLYGVAPNLISANADRRFLSENIRDEDMLEMLRLIDVAPSQLQEALQADSYLDLLFGRFNHRYGLNIENASHVMLIYVDTGTDRKHDSIIQRLAARHFPNAEVRRI